MNLHQTIALNGNVSFGNTFSLEGGASTSSFSIQGNVTSNPVSKIEKDYNLLDNQPSINEVTLIGNKTSEELGLEPTIQDLSEQDIDIIIFGG